MHLLEDAAVRKSNPFRGLLCAAPLAFAAGCDVDVKDPDAPPSADVDVRTEAGRAPDVDVTGSEIDIAETEKTVTVPDVDVKTEGKTITVPDVNVDVPEENANEPAGGKPE